MRAGLWTVKARLEKDGYFTSKAEIVRKRLGCPNADPGKVAKARKLLAAGTRILKTAKLIGLGTDTVQKLKRKLIGQP